MLTHIVVADQSEARFYEAFGVGRPLAAAGRMLNGDARLHERELGADRPGRKFHGSGAATRRRGATPRYSLGTEHTARRHSRVQFARAVGAQLLRAQRRHGFTRLVLVAAPAFLGELRAALPAALRPYLVATVAKDVVHRDVADVRRYLTPAHFNGGVDFPPAKRAVRERGGVARPRPG